MMSISNDLLYQIALTMVPQIGAVHAKSLSEKFDKAKDIFQSSIYTLEKIEGIGSVRAQAIRSFNKFSMAEKEIRFIEKYRIQPLYIKDDHYPKRLLHCYDPPTLLYYKGKADLNAPRTIAVVGTRNNSNYGKQVTENFTREIAANDPLVISGLAFGIDTIAHRAALKNDLQTIAVLAHGLHTIYPPENNSLARSILSNGGLLTEFISGTSPDKHNFPSRNRIVAGLADATLLIETGIKGGSMITADLALNYNREVFAVPGKINDSKSQGCNLLIQQNKAALFTCAQDMVDCLGWTSPVMDRKRIQEELFQELSSNEKILIDLIRDKPSIHFDELHFKSGIPPGILPGILLGLEMKNLIYSMPGKCYRLD